MNFNVQLLFSCKQGKLLLYLVFSENVHDTQLIFWCKTASNLVLTAQVFAIWGSFSLVSICPHTTPKEARVKENIQWAGGSKRPKKLSCLLLCPPGLRRPMYDNVSQKCIYIFVRFAYLSLAMFMYKHSIIYMFK